MRIELPSTPWADAAQRAQDDAHTITLPAQRMSLTDAWLALAAGEEGFRVAIAAADPETLTLTF
jgi:hypothetical protein